MVNVLIIAVIFIIILLVGIGFITQQFYAVQKVAASKPKTLIEKMASSGLGALDTDKFKDIVMSAPSENAPGVESLIDASESGSDWSSKGSAGEVPEEEVFAEAVASTGQSLNLEGKDLQAIYSEYLSAKNLNPFDMEPDFKLGVAYLKFAQYEKAQGEFQKVIDAKPEFPGIYYYLGESFRCNGQFYEAMKAYKKSWEMGMPDSKETQTNNA